MCLVFSQNLLRLSSNFHDVLLREIAIELCLVWPARINLQLPLLSVLVQPLVLAFQSKSEKGELVLVGCVLQFVSCVSCGHLCL